MVIFPPWATTLARYLPLAIAGSVVYGVALVSYGLSPLTTDVGYRPTQPVPYSHTLHALELAIDCRYCHTTVETSAHAAIPPTATCMVCHERIRADSQKLVRVRQSRATNVPIPWVRVHDLPDYAYFDHGAHVSRGVGCVSCHGRVDAMEVVYQAEPLSMGWCLDCHRNPDPHLRPVHVTAQMAWKPEGDPTAYGARLREALAVAPSEDCSTCHR